MLKINELSQEKETIMIQADLLKCESDSLHMKLEESNLLLESKKEELEELNAKLKTKRFLIRQLFSSMKGNR